MVEYICKNGHKANYPNVGYEAREDKKTREFNGHILCKKCGEEMDINGERLG